VDAQTMLHAEALVEQQEAESSSRAHLSSLLTGEERPVKPRQALPCLPLAHSSDHLPAHLQTRRFPLVSALPYPTGEASSALAHVGFGSASAYPLEVSATCNCVDQLLGLAALCNIHG
jgi:hypothetical protein